MTIFPTIVGRVFDERILFDGVINLDPYKMSNKKPANEYFEFERVRWRRWFKTLIQVKNHTVPIELVICKAQKQLSELHSEWSTIPWWLAPAINQHELPRSIVAKGNFKDKKRRKLEEFFSEGGMNHGTE